MQEENQTPAEQNVPEQQQASVIPPQNNRQEIAPEDEFYYEKNYSKRLIGGSTGIFLIILVIIGLFIVRSIGLEAVTFSEAKLYDDYATSLKFALAAVTGLTLAYFMYHPIKPQVKYVPVETPKEQEPAYQKKSDTVWIIAIVVGLTLLYIPGLILLAIYILKKRFMGEKDPDAGKEVSRFRKVAVRPAVGTGTLIVAFILGAVPAFILGIIIGYPLSQHACSLSGSKYC